MRTSTPSGRRTARRSSSRGSRARPRIYGRSTPPSILPPAAALDLRCFPDPNARHERRDRQRLRLGDARADRRNRDTFAWWTSAYRPRQVAASQGDMVRWGVRWSRRPDSHRRDPHAPLRLGRDARGQHVRVHVHRRGRVPLRVCAPSVDARFGDGAARGVTRERWRQRRFHGAVGYRRAARIRHRCAGRSPGWILRRLANGPDDGICDLRPGRGTGNVLLPGTAPEAPQRAHPRAGVRRP